MSVYERLMQAQDLKYREFQTKLVPNISPDSIIGVRTPAMRQIAKELFGTAEAETFLHTLPHTYYEENLVHFFLIALIKDYATCLEEVDCFLPYVDCWPVCDQSSPKVFKKHHKELIVEIRKWIGSDHTYTARFGMRMLMNEFLDSDFKPEYLELVATKEGEDYYLKMMIAWFFATALAKQYDATLPYIREHRLDDWTHKKAIQKAIESFRVSEEHKAELKGFR
ncbi:MAG: DNA alkylation repair protein [Lachnospiraceae bacterium]|nr:DNA alkylation repair protein [Lachnospiraceae bacterium]